MVNLGILKKVFTTSPARLLRRPLNRATVRTLNKKIDLPRPIAQTIRNPLRTSVMVGAGGGAVMASARGATANIIRRGATVLKASTLPRLFPQSFKSLGAKVALGTVGTGATLTGINFVTRAFGGQAPILPTAKQLQGAVGVGLGGVPALFIGGAQAGIQGGFSGVNNLYGAFVSSRAKATSALPSFNLPTPSYNFSMPEVSFGAPSYGGFAPTYTTSEGGGGFGGVSISAGGGGGFGMSEALLLGILGGGLGGFLVGKRKKKKKGKKKKYKKRKRR